MHPKRTLATATVLALLLAPAAAFAERGGNGNGNANGHNNGNNGNGRNAEAQSNRASGTHGCAPGLANREPACVPPGLARQGVTTADWIGPVTDQYAAGDVIVGEDFFIIGNPGDLRLAPLPEGQEYAVIDNTIVVVDSATYTILSLLRAVATVGNASY